MANFEITYDDKSRSGLGFFGVLFLIFLTLKLIGVIDWSWIWIFGPLWIPISILGGVFVLILMLYIFVYIIKKFKNTKKG